MASQKLKAFFLLFALLLAFIQVCSSTAEDEERDDALQSVFIPFLHQRRLLTYNCPSKCSERCRLAGARKRCLQDCMICCRKCKCVPPGTFGNKQFCPCYAKLKNSKGTAKCP